MEKTDKPDIKDLHSLLHPKLGDQLIIESCEIDDLVAPGENYGSRIVRIRVVIRRTGKSESEDLWLVGKLPPVTQYQRDMFDSPYTFKKESYMYETILPAYRKLDVDSGLSEDEAFDIAPMFYGSRFSLKPDEDFDDDAVIILENLKVKNYHCIERRIGCDLSQAKLTIEAMAKFHAFGLAMKEKDPEFFEELKMRSKCLKFKDTVGWKSIIEARLKDIKDDATISEHYELCERTASSASDLTVWTMIPEEPWSTIIHTDLWTNNIMFHELDNGDVDNVKFVDFQNYLFLEATRELTFFLGVGLNQDVIMNNVDELIQLYYDTVIKKLKQLDCDTAPYSRTSFNERIKKDANIEFTHAVCMMKVITMEMGENDSMGDFMNFLEKSQNSESFVLRLRSLVKLYGKQGWLSSS